MPTCSHVLSRAFYQMVRNGPLACIARPPCTAHTYGRTSARSPPIRNGTSQPSLVNRSTECYLVVHINRSECRSAPNRTDPYRTVHRSVVKTALIHRSVQKKENILLYFYFFHGSVLPSHFLQWIGGRIGALFCGSVRCLQTPTTTPSRKELARLMFAGGALGVGMRSELSRPGPMYCTRSRLKHRLPSCAQSACTQWS